MGLGGGLCGPVLGWGGKGFGLRRGGFGEVILGFGVGQVGFAELCCGCFGSGDCVRAWGVKFRGLGGCLGLGRVCADHIICVCVCVCVCS